MNKKKLSVLGAGAWGTALALTAARAGHDVTIWGRDEKLINLLATTNQNPGYLPGVKFDRHIKATTDFDEVMDTDGIILATPAQTTRLMVERIVQSRAAPVPKPPTA